MITEERPVLLAVGTRPEAIKLAPVARALAARAVPWRLLSTGQHEELLGPILSSLDLEPDRTLESLRRGQSLTDLAGSILTGVGPVLEEIRPSWVVVQGDTTTVASVGLAASLTGIPVAHVEAGLRTHDRREPFPEELQRAALAPLADLHLAPTDGARRNLLREGVPLERIRVVGNPVVDALFAMRDRVAEMTWSDLGLPDLDGGRLVLATAHRRESFGAGMESLFAGLARLAESYEGAVTVALPVHANPNVASVARRHLEGRPGVLLLPALGYDAFVKLLTRAELVITDSGGVQEEATALGVPTLVTRRTSERPEALAAGVAELVGTDEDRIVEAATRLLDDPVLHRSRAVPSSVFGDGRAGERIVDALVGAREEVEAGADAEWHPRRRQVVWVVLPAYNEAAALPALLEEIDASMYQAGLTYRVVVVDDGSSDQTPEIVAHFARHLPMIPMRHETNLGLGATIRDGLLEAAGLSEDGDVVITMDADHSHNPQMILRMVRLIREGHDVVVASRYRPGSRVRGVPWFRRFVSYWGSWMFRVLFPIPGIRDYTSGYRAYRADVLRAVIAEQGEQFFDQTGFQCMVDILLKLRGRGLVFAEVPFILRYDLKDGPSKMNVGATIKDTLALIVRRRLGR